MAWVPLFLLTTTGRPSSFCSLSVIYSLRRDAGFTQESLSYGRCRQTYDSAIVTLTKVNRTHDGIVAIRLWTVLFIPSSRLDARRHDGSAPSSALNNSVNNYAFNNSENQNLTRSVRKLFGLNTLK